MKQIINKARKHAGISPDVKYVEELNISSKIQDVIAFNKYVSFIEGYEEAIKWKNIE